MQGPPRAEVQVSRALCAHRGAGCSARAPALPLCISGRKGGCQAGSGGAGSLAENPHSLARHSSVEVFPHRTNSVLLFTSLEPLRPGAEDRATEPPLPSGPLGQGSQTQEAQVHQGCPRVHTPAHCRDEAGPSEKKLTT